MKNFTIILATIVVFWNVENFYDYFDSRQNSSDTEFSSFGGKRWTKKRFLAKCNAVSKVMFWLADRKGAMPDIIAFAEVENAFVLRKLISETPLKKYEYKIVHYDSGDHRGIDVALLYDSEKLTLLASEPVRVPQDSTRDILLSGFLSAEGDSLALLVNHFPSKYGGNSKGDGRIAAAGRLMEVCDSLGNAGWNRILALGDFNEQPLEEAVTFLARKYENIAGRDVKAGAGTIKFDGRWELIDQAFVSGALRACSSFEILYPPFLLEEDKSHSGQKPGRTYTGPRYNAGVSDHLPVCVTIK